MGARKKISAEKRKEALKTMYFAKLKNVPTSPRKMRLVADMIRGMEDVYKRQVRTYLRPCFRT